jgi:hypothetical protein
MGFGTQATVCPGYQQLAGGSDQCDRIFFVVHAHGDPSSETLALDDWARHSAVSLAGHSLRNTSTGNSVIGGSRDGKRVW